MNTLKTIDYSGPKYIKSADTFGNICHLTDSHLFDQQLLLYKKYQFGLFKNKSYSERKFKQKIIYLSNLFRMNASVKKQPINTRLKIIFSKKLNKFFFKDGRNLFMQKHNFKKYLIQKFITKKLFSTIKNAQIVKLTTLSITDLLIQCALFYSYNDAMVFIKTFGVKVNNLFINNPNAIINIYDVFSIMQCFEILKYISKTKTKIINNFKKIKFYKYRTKLYTFRNNYKWVPNKVWLLNYAFIYTHRLSTIEFDWKSNSGVLLYTSNSLNHNNMVSMLDISLYMQRSYTWKYLT